MVSEVERLLRPFPRFSALRLVSVGPARRLGVDGGLPSDAQAGGQRRCGAAFALLHGQKAVIAFQAIIVRKPFTLEIEDLVRD